MISEQHPTLPIVASGVGDELEDVQTAMARMQAEVARAAATFVSLNSVGLPDGIYLADRLASSDWASNHDTTNHEDGVPPPEDAFLPLDYVEGYPTYGTMAIPFWERLPGEPERYHKLFRTYSEMDGVRSTFRLSQLGSERVSAGLVVALFDLYHWEHRAKALDIYLEAMRQRNRVLAARKTEDDHYILGSKLVEAAQEYLLADGTTLSEKGMIEMLKIGSQLQRLSTGLQASGSKASESDGATTDVKAIITHITQQFVAVGVADPQAGKSLMRKALADPATADLAQRLALEMVVVSETQNHDTTKPRNHEAVQLGGVDEDLTPEEIAAQVIEDPTRYSG